MNRRLYWIAGGVVLAVLVWVTSDLLTAQRNARRESAIREAQFRMNSRVAVWLEKERERKPEEYRAYLAIAQTVYTKRNFQRIQQDELLKQSGLLAASTNHVQLYFRIDPEGEFSSPQVPRGTYQEAAVPEVMTQDQYDQNVAVLADVEKQVNPKQLGLELKKAQERSRKAQKGWFAEDSRPGMLEPLWVDENLYFMRRFGSELQGFLVDWPGLRAALVEEVDDLFPEGVLEPAPGEPDDSVLYALPARFKPGALAMGTSPGGEHIAIALMWGLVIFAFVAYGKTLQRADEQRRFASHVTHELRSPLTTFSLYSDLLAEGLLKDEEKKEEYLRTLQSESQRMGHMIENVIAQARLEEGRSRITLANATLRNVVEAARPGLARGCAQHDMQLTVDLGDAADATVSVDKAAVERILTNLVENSCKYGGTPISITAAVHSGTVKLRVRDHGPGVTPEQIKRIFRPYDRGGRDETDAARGLGLGLPLSRELARRMHGDLAYESPRDGGACFVLTFPRS
ncbi:MAG: sensor histidine kinase [Planctomycetota bacterium]|jgi:signal transduction histidine kinase